MKLKFPEMLIIAVMAAMLLSVINVGVAFATSLKVWTSGETIRSTDLNANFAALNAYTGLITNARIDAAAAISHTKMATPALIPKAYVQVGTSTPCSADPCTIVEGSGVSSVNWGCGASTAGCYTVNLSVGLKDSDFATFITPRLNPATDTTYCQVTTNDTSFVTFQCFDDAGGNENVAFSVLIMDVDDPS